MKIIATDGMYVEPKDVKSLVIANGERYDILIPAEAYVPVLTIRFGGIDKTAWEPNGHIAAMAYIRYGDQHVDQDANADYERSTNVPGPSLNGYYGFNDLPITSLKSVYPLKHKGKADKTFYLQFTLDDKFGFMFNNRSFQPKLLRKPLLSQGHELERKRFCPEEIDQGVIPENADNECYHVLNVDYGDVVDILLVNPEDIDRHPIHKHGYHFRVLAEGDIDIEKNGKNYNFYWDIQEQIKNKIVTPNFDYPVSKDTLQSRKLGWQWIRFVADNPGYWFLHCHISFHDYQGFNVVVKVGNRKDWQIPKTFPKCGDFHTCSAHGKPDKWEDSEQPALRPEVLASFD